MAWLRERISSPSWPRRWQTDEKKVLAFAKDIVDRDLDHCVLEIDARLEDQFRSVLALYHSDALIAYETVA